MSREVLQTVLEAIGVEIAEQADVSYSDLPASHKHAAALQTATKLGIIAGDTNANGELTGTVRPDARINRAEVAKIITKVLEGGF